MWAKAGLKVRGKETRESIKERGERDDRGRGSKAVVAVVGGGVALRWYEAE